MGMLPAPGALRLACPACGRYLGTVDGSYSEYPPCPCGIQTTIRVAGKRLRPLISTPAGPLEVKAP